MLLSNLKIGDTAKVIEIDANSTLKTRLKKLGLTNNVELTVLRFAPFGDPMEILFRNFTLAIRKSDAKRVIVEKIDKWK